MTNPNLTILLRIATPKTSEFFPCIKCASSGGITKLKAHRLCALAPSSIVPRNFCSSAQSSHKLNPHGKLYSRAIAVRARWPGFNKIRGSLLACRLENFGWEAWKLDDEPKHSLNLRFCLTQENQIFLVPKKISNTP